MSDRLDTSIKKFDKWLNEEKKERRKKKRQKMRKNAVRGCRKNAKLADGEIDR